MSASGAESITQCADHDNNWCCNADRQHVNCCAESPSPRPFFALADGKAYATVGTSTASSAPNLATITGKADGADTAPTRAPSPTAGSNSPQSSTNAPSETASPSKEAVPTTQLQTSLSSGSAGIVTVVRTQVITPTSPASTSTPAPTDPEKKSKLPIIIGCAVGIPLALALLGILIWLLRKRSHQSKANNHVSKPPFADEILTDGSPAPAYGFVGGAKHNRTSSEKPVLTTYRSDGVTPVVPELAGHAVGPQRPMSTVHGRAELDSGASFAPGTSPHAPNLVEIGGGNGHANGEHSDMHSSWATPELGTYHEADSRPVSSAAQGAPTRGYIPYRPNNLVQPHQAQEMSTVTTPPAAELGMPSPPVAELRTAKTPHP
jgi:hypothetical protein